MLAQLKDRLFRRRLAAETSSGKPARTPIHLLSAKSILVLFPADDAADRKAVDRWRDGFRERKPVVRQAGFFLQDTGGTDFGFPAVARKHLNWYGVPQGAEVAAFRSIECDLLLRLGPPEHRELDFLAATKAATLKVGPYQPDDETSPYHLQFDATRATSLADQLAAIERIFSFTNANTTT